jgi:hypothetical protein
VGRTSYVSLVGLVAVALLVWRIGGGLGPDPAPLDVPAGDRVVATAPLGLAPQPPTGEGGYAFLDVHQDGKPVAFDPCRELRYVVRPDGEPSGGQATLAAAMAELSARTGLRAVFEGATDEGPGDARSAYQPQRYGDRWAPVLVTWSDPEEAPTLAGDVAGYAGPQPWGTSSADSVRYVTGEVVISTTAWAELALRPDGVARQQNLLLHELGHLVGLDHVLDPQQVMYAESVEGQFGYRDGDLRGLALLGSGPCFSGP